MNTIGNFCTPNEVDYEAIVPAYQAAFAEDPWNERSKCADEQAPQRCAGGLSANVVGDTCGTCLAVPTRPAYEPDELVQRFTQLGETRPTVWYIERVESKVALAAVCWLANVKRLVQEKYPDVPQMEPWLTARFGDSSFVYLDEIFRDRSVRPAGNLANLAPMLRGFAQTLGNATVTYRSKNPRLLAKTEADFGDSAAIAWADQGQVPDWRGRSFAVVQAGEAI